MRDPLRVLLICASLFVVAVGTAWLMLSSHTRGDAVIGVVAIGVAFTAFLPGLDAALSLATYYRLRAGGAAIARWHVTAAECDRFRSIDRMRATEGSKLRNIWGVRRRTPPQGIDVVVGPEHILIDDSLQKLHLFVPDGRTVNWLPGDPDCLEFPIYYGPTRGSDASDYTLRIPVPVTARVEGLRAFNYFLTNSR